MDLWDKIARTVAPCWHGDCNTAQCLGHVRIAQALRFAYLEGVAAEHQRWLTTPLKLVEVEPQDGIEPPTS